MSGDGDLDFDRNLGMLRKFFDRSAPSDLLETSTVPAELDEWQIVRTEVSG